VNFTGFPFPLGPLFARRTVRTQVDDGIWTFEQEQSLVNIAVNVRMTVIRLECGGLWVHNPVAPTDECIALLQELDMPVRYIVLGSAQYEHKVFVGPFARRCPDAKVFTVPEQWSWPVDLPSAFFGIFAEGELKDADAEAPWASRLSSACCSLRSGLAFHTAQLSVPSSTSAQRRSFAQMLWSMCQRVLQRCLTAVNFRHWVAQVET